MKLEYWLQSIIKTLRLTKKPFLKSQLRHFASSWSTQMEVIYKAKSTQPNEQINS